MACSTPPIYWSTGSQYAALSLSNGPLSFFGSVYLAKYHDDSTNVSIVSVSLFASSPQLGHLTLTKDSVSFNGEPPSPVNLTSVGSSTGRSLSGTGTTPHFSQ